MGGQQLDRAQKSSMPQDPSPLPFRLVRRRSAHNSQAFGHPCKRPFLCVSSICKRGRPGSGVMQAVEFRFAPEIPDQRRNLAIPTAIAPEKAALNARAATPSTRPAAVGCDRRDGCSQYRPRPARQADVAVRPPSPPGRGTPGPGQTASHPSASVTAAYPTDLHIESELSGPMRNATDPKCDELRAAGCGTAFIGARLKRRSHPSGADAPAP